MMDYGINSKTLKKVGADCNTLMDLYIKDNGRMMYQMDKEE
jgi:hypothetical protein